MIHPSLLGSACTAGEDLQVKGWWAKRNEGEISVRGSGEAESSLNLCTGSLCAR